MESIRAYNMRLVSNILPMHVAQHFLKAQNNKDEVRIYSFLIRFLTPIIPND